MYVCERKAQGVLRHIHRRESDEKTAERHTAATCQGMVTANRSWTEQSMESPLEPVQGWQPH